MVNLSKKLSMNVERSRSMDLTIEVPHEAKVENTGTASDLCDLQPYKCLMCNQKFSKEKYLEAHIFMIHQNKNAELSSFNKNDLETIESTEASEKVYGNMRAHMRCQRLSGGTWYRAKTLNVQGRRC